MRAIDIVAKETGAVRMAETTVVASGFGYDNIHPVFEERLPIVWERMADTAIEPGMRVAYYDWPDDNGHVVVHLGFDIGDQPLTDTDDVRIVELPAVE